MKTIFICLDDPQYRHEAQIIARMYNHRHGNYVHVSPDTKFGKTKSIHELSIEDAKEIAKMVSEPSFYHITPFNNTLLNNSCVSSVILYDRPGIIDPKRRLPHIIIWDYGRLSYCNLEPKRKFSLPSISYLEEIRKYLINKGYLVLP